MSAGLNGHTEHEYPAEPSKEEAGVAYIIGLIIYGYVFFLFYGLMLFVPLALLSWLMPILSPLALLAILAVLFLAGMRAHSAALMYAAGTHSFVEAMTESGEQIKTLLYTTPWLNRIIRLFRRK
jgi:hypothetical protein